MIDLRKGSQLNRSSRLGRLNSGREGRMQASEK